MSNLFIFSKIYYNLLDRNYRTELPDGSYTKTEWTAWEQRVWDNNDTVLESAWYLARKDGQMGIEEKDAANKAAEHANTPTIIHTDSLGRDFYTIQDDGINPLINSHEVLDIQGNRLAVVDGRGLTPLTYHYNMLQSPCYQDSIDSGTQRTLVDAAGQPLYAWDAEDRKTEIIYDELRRPLKRIINDKELERYIYGEGLVNDKVNNLRGQLYQHYDGSGLQQINIYDFKGNALETQQQLLENPTLSDSNWDSSPALSTEVFAKLITYDALNRPITQTDPGGNVQAFTYDKGGLLETVKLNNENYVNDIHYDAKGQRQAIWYGNGTKTSYTYDAFTFRLRRLLTVNLNTNDILQDLNYWYDPVGNITEIQDDAQQTIFFNNTVVSPRQQFTYDALYRLIQAQGRELIGTATFGSEDNWNDAAWQTTQKGDGNAVQNYTQLYTYDAVGNILELQHIATAGSYTRTYAIATDSNQLLSTTVGSATYTYQYDARGNMATMPHLDGMHWNLNNELHQIENGTMQAFYQYSGGQRIRKYVDKGSVKEERIYLGNFEIYRKFDHASSLVIERTTVHVSDDTGRIAMLEKRTEGNAGDDHGTAEELTRYIYSNHLQSASLELDETGEVISYEEYHPYGTTSYQAMNANIHAVAKRYRYTGKERDEESGLYYFQARFYICWLGRWLSPDPINSENYNLQKGNPQRNKERNYTELTASPYEYCYDSPVVYNDPTGEQPPIKEKDQTLKDGSGDVQHQKFTVQINGTESDFKRFKEAFTSDPSKVTNNMWATYVLKDLDKSKGLSAGDRIDIDITGPDNGSVRVVSVSSDNNSFQAMFQPLEGHPEAGHIVFTGTYSQNQQGEGVIEFTISNVTRQSLGVMKYMPGAESFGRYAQVDQWKEVMANVADFFGKNVSHASSSIAIREWDKETQSQGKWKSSESKVLTQDINKIRERRINARIRLEKEYERQKMWWTQPKY